MKLRFISSLLFCILCFACKKDTENANCGIKINEDTSAQNISILFIGTSHTFYNEMPGLVSAIARSAGDSVYTAMSAPGGYDFERHFKLPETITALNSRRWNYIVLQESGWRVALPSTEAKARIYPFVDSLKKLINSSNPGAKLLLYMTHGYVNGVNTFGETAWCAADPQVCTYLGMLARIKENYLHIRQQLNAEIAPCGIIWKALKDRNSMLELHDADGIHPNLAGSYANAVTIYSIIRKKRMKQIFVPAALPNDQAILIQNTVSDVLFDCNPSWEGL